MNTPNARSFLSNFHALQVLTVRPPRLGNCLGILVAAGAALCSSIPTASAATASILDLNGTSPGFYDGSATTADITTTATWTTDPTGVATPGILPAGNAMLIGTNLSDFSGTTLNINMNLNGNLTGTGFFVVSTNCTVTMSGTVNSRWNNAFSWVVASNSTLIVTSTGNNNGYNFNSKACTFGGGGTINFQSAFCANGNALNTMNMPGGTLQINQTRTSNFGAAAAGAFTLTAGILQFGSATALADVFAGWANNNVFSINGGTIDNTSGAAGVINMGTSGRFSIGGDFTFTGSSDLSFTNAPVTNAANHTITVVANTLAIDGPISGAGGLTKAGAGTLKLGGVNTYTGPTVVNAGTLALYGAGTISNSALTLSSSVLDMSGSTGGAIIAPTFTVTNSTLTLAAAPSTATNIVANTLNVGSPSTINLSSLPLVTAYPTAYHLIKGATVNGTLNFVLGTIPTVSPPYVGFLTNRADGSVDFVLTGGPTPVKFLTWSGLNGGSPDGTWDVGNTPTWLVSGTPATFNQSDFVNFNDTAAGLTAINMTTTLTPGNLTVSNNTLQYTLGGGGKLSGTIGLLKQGTAKLILDEGAGNDFTGGVTVSAGTLQIGNNDTAGALPTVGNIVNNGALLFTRQDLSTVPNIVSGSGTITQNGSGTLNLAGVNTFTGTVTVAQGTLQIGNSAALGTTNGITTIASGATLDFAANANNIGQEQVSVSGSGVLGGGAIINSSGSGTFVAANVARVTMTGDTTFGGTGRWDLRSSNTADPTLASLSTGGVARKLTKVGANQIGLVGLTLDPALGEIEVQGGILGMEAATTSLGNTASNLTVWPGATFQMFAITNVLNKVFTLGSDGIVASVSATSGSNNVVGPMTLTNDCIISANPAAVSLTLNNVLSGPGRLIKNGAGLLTLSGNSPSFSGGLQLNNGGLTLSGTLSNGLGVTTMNGKFVLNGSLLGVTAGLTNISAILAGFGSCAGPVDVFGTVTPGDTNVAGTLTFGSTLLEPGAGLTYDLGTATTPGSGSNDLIVVNGDLTLNGNTITINPLALLQTGVPYRLFNYTGTLVVNSPLNAQNQGNSTYVFAVDTSTPGQVNVTVTGGGPPVWNGGSATDSNWSDAANWNGISLAPNNQLYFAGNNRLNNTNDISPDTAFSDIVFNAGAGSFVLHGNPIIPTGNIINSSSNPQTIDLGLDFSANLTLNGGTGGLIMGGGLTNTTASPTKTTLTLSGTGTLTNLLGSVDPTGTNTISLTSSDANWTLMDNPASATITVPWALDILAGTFNFGTATSAPKLSSTTINGGPQDNRVGNVTGTVGTFNMVNGTLTTIARLNTATVLNSTGIVNQVGGTLNIGQQFQGANGANAGEFSQVNLSGGTMNIGGGGGQFYNASRGPGILTVSSNGTLNCGTLDVSRSILTTVGIVNLNGGAISASRVGTATANSVATITGSSATFNFNGGTLRASASSTTYFQGSTAAPVIPITTIVKAGGAIIDTDTNAISILEPLQHDSGLGATVDGGLKKLGPGTLTVTVASTYTGPTVVSNGTLAVNGSLGLTPVTVESGGTLAGTGSLGSNIIVHAGGTLAPGGLGVVGTLTTSRDVFLQGNTAIEVNKTAGTKDLLNAANVTYGGTLAVTNLSGTLAAGDSFKLFSATSYLGSFAAISPVQPGQGLKWDTSQLNSTGTLGISAVPRPAINNFFLSSGNAILMGTNGTAGNLYRVLTTTNLALPLNQWTPITTNQFDASGNFATTNAITPPAQFFRIQVL